MEAQLLGMFAAVVASVGATFWMMRAMIADLRSQNKSQQEQITANLLVGSGSVARIVELEKKANKCESDHAEFRRQMMAVSDTCPITNEPCPLRAIFKGK